MRLTEVSGYRAVRLINLLKRLLASWLVSMTTNLSRQKWSLFILPNPSTCFEMLLAWECYISIDTHQRSPSMGVLHQY